MNKFASRKLGRSRHYSTKFQSFVRRQLLGPTKADLQYWCLSFPWGTSFHLRGRERLGNPSQANRCKQPCRGTWGTRQRAHRSSQICCHHGLLRQRERLSKSQRFASLRCWFEPISSRSTFCFSCSSPICSRGRCTYFSDWRVSVFSKLLKFYLPRTAYWQHH